MNQEAIGILKEVVTKWTSIRRFSSENKKVDSFNSPITDDEFVLRFSNSINNFFCDGKQISINLVSKPFHTNTISDNPLSRNIKGDKYRLEKFLDEFDELFYKEVENKLDKCLETLTTSEPLFL
ncbi:MAG: hypothetical protein Q8K02_18500 [Flavobacterium sp.]|nr:hypothetical protein [Flavobacterium sp.]